MIYTIGHSTRTLEELTELLKQHGVALLADVRTVPRSRHNPQFNKETLAEALPGAHIEYLPFPGLGGLRKPAKDSPNGGWENRGFRGFADYMLTNEFELAIGLLLRMSEGKQIALMCAEALYWRCHRLLISDALTVRGIPVRHILSTNKTEPHKLTAFAKVERARILYPPDQFTLDFS